MTDIPKRLAGPKAVNLANASTIYTVPSRTKTFVRDVTFTNTASVDILMRIGFGSLSTVENRVFDLTIPQKNTFSFRGLWVLDEGEIISAQQVTATAPVGANVANGTGTAATTCVTGAWTPAADTLYILTTAYTKTDAPDTISSITGNGTWTLINGTTTGSVAAVQDHRSAAYYWYSSAAGSNATTTVTYGGTEALSRTVIDSITNVFRTGTSNQWPTYLPIQSVVNQDSATSATASGLTATLSTALGGGYVVGWNAKSQAVNAADTSTAPTGYTEIADVNHTDGAANSMALTTYLITTPPATSTTVGANTWSTSRTIVRTAGAFELAPANFVNVMVNGVEVSS